MTPRLHQQHGFTLIEMLVAVALMALIATILVSSLQIGGHSWQRVTGLTESMQDIAQAQSFLRERLGTIYPFERNTSDGSPGFVMSDGNMLEFSGFAPVSLDEGIMRYQIAVSTSSPGVLEVRSHHDGRDLPDSLSAEWAHETLLSHVDSIAIEFWQQSQEGSGRWVDHWMDPGQLPTLIRVEVKFPPKDSRRWPPFYVEPRVDTAANCQFDVVSRRCRRPA